MHLTLTLVVGISLPAQPGLDLAPKSLSQWQGKGGSSTKVGRDNGLTTADDGNTRTTVRHLTFTLPESAMYIEFSAAVHRPTGSKPGETIDLVLEAARRQGAPREVRQGDDWAEAETLLPPLNNQPREYRWHVERFAGRRVRIAIVDEDERPGCYLVTSGFRLITRDELNAKSFAEQMRSLQGKGKFPKALRYDTKHFMAMSTAGAGYTEYRLYNCETIYALFFPHFRKRGFEIRPPAEKFMVGIFDTQENMETFMGGRISTAVTGLYHPASNRLLVYDYGSNRAFAAGAAHAGSEARKGSSDLERERRLLTFNRAVFDYRNDTNISTVMHEVAHQLSFNCGLLNRKGDVPVWIAEGLAVYCESTVKGAWQGIGESNPKRAAALKQASQNGDHFIPLRVLLRDDSWIRKASTVDQIILGYAQSWALFRLLMEEEPKRLKAYMKLIYDRRTSENRLTDFAEVFGKDFLKFEKRYYSYMRELGRREAR